jgi:peptidyl-tRNA hydrolase
MFQVVGLGNYTHPGTRHNAGFLALNHINAALLNTRPWTLDKKISGWINPFTLTSNMLLKTGAIEDSGEMDVGWKMDIVLFKPKEFMNFSGGPVSRLCM